jgi:hypothetical protein
MPLQPIDLVTPLTPRKRCSSLCNSLHCSGHVYQGYLPSSNTLNQNKRPSFRTSLNFKLAGMQFIKTCLSNLATCSIWCGSGNNWTSSRLNCSTDGYVLLQFSNSNRHNYCVPGNTELLIKLKVELIFLWLSLSVPFQLKINSEAMNPSDMWWQVSPL